MNIKILLLTLGAVFVGVCANAQGMAINATGMSADNSAMLDVSSTGKGMLVPRMTAIQRDSIAAPATGLLVYQLDSIPSFYYYTGIGWQAIGTPSSDTVSFNDTLTQNLYTNGFLLSGGDTTGILLGSNGQLVGKGFLDSGADLTESGAGTKLIWYPKQGAFRAGGIDSTEWDNGNLGSYSMATGYATAAVGFASSALGEGTVADSEASFAIGYETITGGFASFAMGEGSAADSEASGAMGYGTITNSFASFAIGEGSATYNEAAIATGYFTNSVGFASTAMGEETTAGNEAATAMGYNTGAVGFASTAMGEESAAIGEGATVAGVSEIALGFASTAMGEGTTADTEAATAMGYNTAAVGFASTAMGEGTTADTEAATAMGSGSIADGFAATAMGLTTTADGFAATAMGDSSIADGFASTATGFYTTASGDYSTAMGTLVSTNGYIGSFIIGDASPFSGGDTAISNTDSNQMMMRFDGGYVLYSSGDLSSSVTLSSGGGSWNSLSDRRKKENFQPLDKEAMLMKVCGMPITNWNYKSQPATQKHIGPMAQDFYAAFQLDGLGNDTTINTTDIDGVNMIAIQALEKRTKDLKEENQLLKDKNIELTARMDKLEALLNKQFVEKKLSLK